MNCLRMLAGDSAEPIAGDERALTQDMRIHSSVASPALPTSPQAVAKSSGDSFLSILAGASEEQKSGATGTDTDPHADRRGAEADSNEQNDTASPSRALDGGTRSNGPGQHIVQKNDSAVASAKGQGALAASNGPRAAVPGAHPTASADETKDASASPVRAFDSSAMAQAPVEAQASMSSFQGALASLSAAQVSPDGQAGVRVKNQFESMAGGGISAQAKNSAEGIGSSGVAAGQHSRLVNGMDGTISSAAAAFDPTLESAAKPGSAGDKVQPLFASVPDSSTVNETGVQSSGSLRTTPSGTAVAEEFAAAAPAGVPGSSLAPVAAPLGADASPNSATNTTNATNASRGADAGQAGPLDSRLSQQGDSSWSGFGSTERSADRAGEPAVAVIEDLVSAQPGLESLSDLLAPETKTGPGKQSTSAANPILSNAPAAPASKSTDALASLAATKAGVAGIEPLALPTVPALAAVQSSSQPVVNGGAKALSDAGGAKNTTAANTTDATSGNAMGSGSGPVDGSSHNAQSNGQAAQDSSAAPSQTSGTVANAVAQVQTQVPVAQMDSAPAASTHRAQDGSDVSSEFAGQQAGRGTVHEEGSEPVATSSINTARLLQSMGESEMRVGMRSSEFGDISIRTSVSQQQMVAQISLDHSDLSQAIAAHVSTVQAKLSEDYGIHASIEVHNLGSGLANDPGQSSQREQSDFRRSARPQIGLPGAEESSSVQFAAVASVSSGNRLDIRA
jgi:hypothetical protein